VFAFTTSRYCSRYITEWQKCYTVLYHSTVALVLLYGHCTGRSFTVYKTGSGLVWAELRS
jgi:hypothetical protein